MNKKIFQNYIPLRQMRWNNLVKERAVPLAKLDALIAENAAAQSNAEGQASISLSETETPISVGEPSAREREIC